MLIEVKLGYAGAAALIAQATGAIIDEVYTTEWSVTLLMDEEHLPNRTFERTCQRQGLMWRDEHNE